jgi:hypothetical protein
MGQYEILCVRLELQHVVECTRCRGMPRAVTRAVTYIPSKDRSFGYLKEKTEDEQWGRGYCVSGALPIQCMGPQMQRCEHVRMSWEPTHL